MLRFTVSFDRIYKFYRGPNSILTHFTNSKIAMVENIHRTVNRPDSEVAKGKSVLNYSIESTRIYFWLTTLK